MKVQTVDYIKSVVTFIIVILISLYVCKTNETHAYSLEEPVEYLGTYYKPSNLSIYSIPRWQLDIYKELKVPFKTVLYLHTLKVLECPNRQDGLCYSWADVGPFQINQIHTEDFKYSYKLYKDNNSYELFKFQASWTYERCKRKVEEFNITEDRVERIKKLAIIHNGNTRITSSWVQFRYIYWDRSVKVYNILKEYYKDIDWNSLDY